MNPLSTIGAEEEAAVLRVIRSKKLSGYLAGSHQAGNEILSLERAWAKFFSVKYALACNSATSGLLAACMAIGVGWGDEVIVPFLTMSATACAPNVLGAQIVMADVDKNLCIDPHHVSRLINENTKAVIATNLFGHPAQLHLLRAMCDSAGIILIEDNAQAIGAMEDGQYTGTIGHIGVFSLNYHKQIQAGEGGVCVTDDSKLALALQNAINHGECYSSPFPGLNLRMTELTAAIAKEQLKKLPDILDKRTELALRVQDIIGRCRMRDIIKSYPNRTGCDNTYYAVPFRTGNPYLACDFVKWLEKYSGITFVDGYHGNLFNLGISKKWIKDPTIKYADVSNMLLLETCAYDITEDHLGLLERKICNEGRRTA